MSDSTPRSLREELEIRVVALLTGELSDADADELEKILSVDEELAAYRDQMAVLIGRIHDARAEIAPEEGLRLSDERRAEIFGEIDPDELNQKHAKKLVSFKRRLLEWAAVLALLFILASMAVPSFQKVRSVSYEIPKQDTSGMGKPALDEVAEYHVLETSVSAERIESTPQPIILSAATPNRVEEEEQVQIARLSVREDIAAPPPLPESSMAASWNAEDTAAQLGATVGRKSATTTSEITGTGLYGDHANVDAFDGGSDLFAPVPAAKPADTALAKKKAEKSNEIYAGYISQIEEEELGLDHNSELLAILDDAEQPPEFFTRGRAVADCAPMSVRETLDSRLEHIVIPQINLKGMKLSRVLEVMSELSMEYDPKGSGVNIVGAYDLKNDPAVTLRMNRVTLSNALAQISEAAGQEFYTLDSVVVVGEREMTDTTGSEYFIHTMLPKVEFTDMPLSEVVSVLRELSVEYDPTEEGVDIVYEPVGGYDPRVNISLCGLYLGQILQLVSKQVGYEMTAHGKTAYIQPQGNSEAERVAEARAKNTRQIPKYEKQTREEPISTFSLNVSDVSFELAQAALENSRVPNPQHIRSEEFLNSFHYGDPTPQPDEPVSLNWEIADLPYAHGRQVVRFSLQTGAAGRSAGQPLNLNLLVDNSGSMQRPDRRAIMENSLQSLKDKLQPNDQLSVVLFSRQPKLIANARTPHEQQVAVDLALEYRPEGGTNLEAGLDAAYSNALQNFDPAASNRVILMTDGAANLGEVNAPELAKKVIYNRQQGIALDAYGIGWDDYNDELLEEITRNGDGRYAFLNSPETAADDFAEKLAGSLRVAAADVKVQIVWNPQRVTTYRQVGYDLHQLKTEDFRDNTVDAAEIGEAESGTALYVLQLNQDDNAIGRLGTLHVRYRDPSTNTYKEQAWPLEMPRSISSLEEASPSLRLATTSALFAERLARNPYAADVSFDELSKLSSDLPQAFPTQQRVVELQNMIHNARILLGDAK